jgi:hypothetical protein
MKKYIPEIVVVILLCSCIKEPFPEIYPIEVQYISSSELSENLRLQNVFYKDSKIVGYHNSIHYVSLWNDDLSLNSMFGREGQGPGEFGSISSVIPYLDDYLILDTTNRTIHRFDNRGNYISSIYYSDRIMSLIADSNGIIYAGVAELDKIFVRASTFEEFDNFKVIFAMNINDLFETAHILNLYNDYLLINRLFTNQTVLIDTRNQRTKTLTNHFIPEEANYSRNGPYKIPEQPVWRTNAIIEDQIFQLRNIPESKSEIYRSDLNGNIDALITFNHYTTSFFELGEEIWMFSPDTLYKYSKSSFIN